jgi:hypothetical protein
MNELLKAMQTGDTRTENEMLTNSTSLNECVDFFFTAGALRNQPERAITAQFSLAFNENPLTAMKLLFWARDIRGGAGERRLARVIYNYLANEHEDVLIKNISLITEYGRWDDLVQILGYSTKKLQEAALGEIKKGLVSKNALCAKWMPRPNKNGKVAANIIRKYLNLTPKEYRKMLAELTTAIETNMCAKDFASINYEHVPSVAMARYQNAFNKNDGSRFGLYKEALESGEAKINAGAVYPHDVTKSVDNGDSRVANAQWLALPNYMEGSTERIMPMCDVSGSMTGLPMDVSVALGLYISERNEGPFKDYFMTFTSRPTLQKTSGTLSERMRQIKGPAGYDTDIAAAFDAILDSAMKQGVSKDEMPTMLLLLSDMEFNDYCITGKDMSALEMIKQKYNDAGYEMPKIVFWNLNARPGNVPIRFDETGTALVSGFSPSILTALLKGEEFTPVGIMNTKINEDRYMPVTI